MDNNLRIETPLGAIMVRPSYDSTHPGVWVDLRRADAGEDAPLALIEFCNDDADANGDSIVTRVWDDVCEEDYRTRVVHQGIEKFFEVS